MNTSGIFSEIKKHPWVLALVILVHLGVIILLSVNLSSDEKPPMPAAKKHNIIDAVAVDAQAYDKREQEKKQAALRKAQQEELKKQQALEKKRQAAALAAKRAEEKKRKQREAAEKKRRLEAEKKKQIAIAKKKEQQRLAAEKRAAEKLAAEKKAAEEKRRRQEQERKRQEAQRLEAERIEKERLEAERLEAERQKRLAEEERLRREAEKEELARALQEEERREEEARKAAEYAARLLTLREQYVVAIAQRVENNWLKPASMSEGMSCEVIVKQTMSGGVIDVRLQSCPNDEAFKRSVKRAVYKAEPLPSPPNPDVFDQEIIFTFKPK